MVSERSRPGQKGGTDLGWYQTWEAPTDGWPDGVITPRTARTGLHYLHPTHARRNRPDGLVLSVLGAAQNQAVGRVKETEDPGATERIPIAGHDPVLDDLIRRAETLTSAHDRPKSVDSKSADSWSPLFHLGGAPTAPLRNTVPSLANTLRMYEYSLPGSSRRYVSPASVVR